MGRLSNDSIARYPFTLLVSYEVHSDRPFINEICQVIRSYTSVISMITGSVAVLRPDLFRNSLVFRGMSVDFLIKGAERQSLKSQEVELSTSPRPRIDDWRKKVGCLKERFCCSLG